ncbi:hypothetical protein, partial [Alistipes finegoldii]|uniref:hypothetical protein n=1 Tax=Alistipes finegoldii TaxID=214856 RepID=UPI003A89D98A
ISNKTHRQTCPIMQFYCSEQMQNRELNTCKQDIYSFLHFLLPTNTEPNFGPLSFCAIGDFEGCPCRVPVSVPEFQRIDMF